MDAEFIKSITGLLTAAGIGGVFAALVKSQTDRDANKIAQSRLQLEQDERESAELAERRKEEANRIQELKADIRELREREKELEARYRDQGRILEDRIAACRECGYFCVDTLKSNAARRAVEEPGVRGPEDTGKLRKDKQDDA